MEQYFGLEGAVVDVPVIDVKEISALSNEIALENAYLSAKVDRVFGEVNTFNETIIGLESVMRQLENTESITQDGILLAQVATENAWRSLGALSASVFVGLESVNDYIDTTVATENIKSTITKVGEFAWKALVKAITWIQEMVAKYYAKLLTWINSSYGKINTFIKVNGKRIKESITGSELSEKRAEVKQLLTEKLRDNDLGLAVSSPEFNLDVYLDNIKACVGLQEYALERLNAILSEAGETYKAFKSKDYSQSHLDRLAKTILDEPSLGSLFSAGNLALALTSAGYKPVSKEFRDIRKSNIAYQLDREAYWNIPEASARDKSVSGISGVTVSALRDVIDFTPVSEVKDEWVELDYILSLVESFPIMSDINNSIKTQSKRLSELKKVRSELTADAVFKQGYSIREDEVDSAETIGLRVQELQNVLLGSVLKSVTESVSTLTAISSANFRTASSLIDLVIKVMHIYDRKA